MFVTALNKFTVFKGEDAWLPFLLVDGNGSPVYLTPYWTRLTCKIQNGSSVITKTSDDAIELYAYTANPPAFFVVKLTSADTSILAATAALNMEIILETTLPGLLKQVFLFPASLTAKAVTIPL